MAIKLGKKKNSIRPILKGLCAKNPKNIWYRVSLGGHFYTHEGLTALFFAQFFYKLWKY